MTTALFAHLHVHSHHSLAGGTASVESLMRRAAEFEMPALALTDRLSLAGLVELFDAGRRCGVKPIAGVDLPLAAISAPANVERVFNTSRNVDPLARGGQGAGGLSENARTPAPSHSGTLGAIPEITLLALTDAGLRNLFALVNLAWRNSRGGHAPHVSLPDLHARQEGLVVFTGGPRTELGRMMLGQARPDRIEAHLSKLVESLGRNAVHFEVIERGGGVSGRLADHLTQISEFLDMPAIASNDVWHLEPSHALAHDFLKGEPCDCARWRESMRRQPATAHFTSPSDMRERFIHRSKLLENTLALANRVTANLDLARRRYPQQDFSRGEDSNSFLWDLTFRMALERLGTLTEEHKERLNAELNHIAEEEFANCILILWRLAAELDKAGIQRGIGEGTLTTSLVAHVIGLTEINPLAHRLEFRGFIGNVGETGLLGLEVPSRAVRVAEESLLRICGESKVARVGRVVEGHRGKLHRDLAAWARLPQSQATKALSSWPRRTVSIAEAQRAWESKEVEESAMPKHLPLPILAHLSQVIHPRRGEIIPSGGEVVVSGEDLQHLIPMAPLSRSALPLAEFDAQALDLLQLLRIEIRTRSGLNILDHGTEWVRREENADFLPEKIPLDDAETWALIGRGQTTGIPGLDRITTKSLLRAEKPRTLDELIDIIHSVRSHPELTPVGDAIMALRCAYLKSHHPISFMTAMLTEHHADRRLVRILMREATAMGIRLLAPDINTSQFEFSQEGKSIRAGLMCVRGMTREAFASVERARLGGAFQDLNDLWERMDHGVFPPSVLANLVKGGVLDGLDSDRSRMLAMASQIGRGGGRRGPTGQALDLFEVSPDAPEPSGEQVDAATLARYEQQVLGTALTGDPLAPHAALIRSTGAIAPAQLQSAAEGDLVTVIGFIDHDERSAILGGDEPEHILDLEGQVIIVSEEITTAVQEHMTRGEPMLAMGTVGRLGHERFLRAMCVVPLDRVMRTAESALLLSLDLSSENRRTLKLLLPLFEQYPGKTKVEIAAPPQGASRRLCHRLEQTRIHWSPPFQHRLRKILTEESITLRRQSTPGE